jgi:hypothetical protein
MEYEGSIGLVKRKVKQGQFSVKTLNFQLKVHPVYKNWENLRKFDEFLVYRM